MKQSGLDFSLGTKADRTSLLMVLGNSSPSGNRPCGYAVPLKLSGDDLAMQMGNGLLKFGAWFGMSCEEADYAYACFWLVGTQHRIALSIWVARDSSFEP